MKQGFVLNPDETFVEDLRRKIRENNKWCLYAEKGPKKNKCNKACASWDDCPCGMYIKEQNNN